jgi:two-component system, OmpR family, KDP operon response regulator KdpE
MEKILVVDDEPEVRTLLRVAFRASYQVIEAANGQQGLQMMAEHAPALIITDMAMPVMNGLEMVKSLRMADHHVKILAYSGSLRGGESRSIMLAAGVDDCLTKPAPINVLREAVAALLAS